MQKILIIEDDKTQNDVLANFLRKAGYEVFSAYTLAQGKELLTPEIKLIVLDLNLPDGHGFDFLRELRQHSTIPVIVLTAFNDEFTQLNVFELQADEYVDKPASPLVMTKRIEALMKRIYPSNSKVNLINFTVDFENYRIVDNSGAEIPLTTKEFNFLKLLYEKQGKPVLREHLMEVLWGFEYRDEIRLLDSHVRNIRKKLGSDTILTVKNVGYRLNIKEAL